MRQADAQGAETISSEGISLALRQDQTCVFEPQQGGRHGWRTEPTRNGREGPRDAGRPVSRAAPTHGRQDASCRKALCEEVA